MVISSLTAASAAPFARLLPASELGRVLDGRAYGLAAVAGTQDAPEAAGVLVFSVEAGSDGEKDGIAGILRWLYVAEAQRRSGVGEALLREFFRIADGSGIEHLLCDVPMPEEYDGLCFWLESWGFDFSLTDVYEAETTLGALLQNRAVAGGDGAGVLPLGGISIGSFRTLLARLRELPDTPRDLDGRYEYYDPEISCVTLANGLPDGALLVHRDAQGALELEVLRSMSAVPHDFGRLVAFAAKAAARTLPPETPLRYLCRTDGARNVTAKLFPDLRPLLVRRGYLYNGPETPDKEA